MSATATFTLTLRNMPQPALDERLITHWIEARLNDARNHFIRNVSRGGGAGRQYGSHRASAPGEYPATDEGRLVNSIDYRMTGPRSGRLHSDLIYAGYLTTGTERMAPRKMLVDALNETLSERPENDVLARAVTLRGQSNVIR